MDGVRISDATQPICEYVRPHFTVVLPRIRCNNLILFRIDNYRRRLTLTDFKAIDIHN